MDDDSSFDALEWLALAGQLMGLPVLVAVQLVIESPVLRREPASPGRRRSATVLAIIALIAATPLAVMSWALGVFGLLLLGGLVVPAVLTLVRLRQAPPAETTPDRRILVDDALLHLLAADRAVRQPPHAGPDGRPHDPAGGHPDPSPPDRPLGRPRRIS